jgi:hypothetical protein
MYIIFTVELVYKKLDKGSHPVTCLEDLEGE